MKKIFILLVIFFGMISCDQKTKTENRTDPEIYSSTVNNDIKSVKDLITNSFEDIFSDLDSTKIKKYYTDDFLLLENGIVWNNDSIRNYINKARKETEIQNIKRRNRFGFIKAVHNQNSIWIAYDNYGTWVKEADTLGTVHWLESVIAIKDKNNWKLEQLHSTIVQK
ncbi:DUF4440 domain-containing protein [Sinomicrobium weinanense]|uniref:DUF4440 domain-containing protein n=1 Tax=Sinomicrobium weinanense TaxID=2842200 RepID=A0A926JPJ6_9FLAO|nr:DUF4440 domain-containing protein [Sinomicrobium weinanense]MBC9794886.1 DUF4440 domain-containing protein [Sinomicrobium weinanense]MBU3125657.1 DUF4440 domain-containing protein [Sinomicrobium weinanense]